MIALFDYVRRNLPPKDVELALTDHVVRQIVDEKLAILDRTPPPTLEQALGKMYLIEARIPLIDQGLALIEQEWSKIQSRIVDSVALQIEPQPAHVTDRGLKEVLVATEWRLRSMGINMALAVHDRYNSDPHHYGGKLQDIDEASKPAYRRALDMHEHATSVLKQKRERLEAIVAEIKNRITSAYSNSKPPEEWGLN